MLITPVSNISPITSAVHVAPFASPPAAPATSQRAALTSVGLTPAASSIAPLQALKGHALVSTPIVDFPGVAAGDQFTLAKGSKVGMFNVKGNADILGFSDDAASFHIKAGAFGIKVDVQVDVTRIDDTHVRITSTGSGIPSQSAVGEIVRSERNHAEFRDVDGRYRNTVIQRDGQGVITIDAEVPTFGNAHLVLAPR